MEMTTTRISPGSYAGGPRRFDPEAASGLGSPERLRGLTNMEDLRAAARISYRRRNKQRRLIAGVLVALALALSVGLTVARNRPTIRPASAESAQRRGGIEGMLADERQRILRELWKMEALEASRGLR